MRIDAHERENAIIRGFHLGKTKVACIMASIDGTIGDEGEKMIAAYEGTPFKARAAKVVARLRKLSEKRAEAEVERAEISADLSVHQAERGRLEIQLANLRKLDANARAELLGKLQSRRNPMEYGAFTGGCVKDDKKDGKPEDYTEWVNFFKGTPLFKKALKCWADCMRLEAMDRKAREAYHEDHWRARDAARAEAFTIEAEYAAWCAENGTAPDRGENVKYLRLL